MLTLPTKLEIIQSGMGKCCLKHMIVIRQDSFYNELEIFPIQRGQIR